MISLSTNREGCRTGGFGPPFFLPEIDGKNSEKALVSGMPEEQIVERHIKGGYIWYLRCS